MKVREDKNTCCSKSVCPNLSYFPFYLFFRNAFVVGRFGVFYQCRGLPEVYCYIYVELTCDIGMFYVDLVVPYGNVRLSI